MTVECSSCGFSENRDVARFCRQCGAPLVQSREVAAVAARCSTTGESYAMVFERVGDGPWVLRRTEAGPSSATPGENEGIRLEEIAWERGEAEPCPHCRNWSVIQCGACGRLFCSADVEEGAAFECAWCGKSGRIEGYIRQLDGEERL